MGDHVRGMPGTPGEKVALRGLPPTFYVIASAVLLVDQLVKALIVRSVALHERIEVIPHLLTITHNQNPGAAFGMLPKATGGLIVVGVLIIVILWLYGRRVAACVPLWVGLSLQVGGALGNMVDRVFRGPKLFQGCVVDFIDVRITASFTWPTFNVADIAITAGAFLIAYAIITGKDIAREGAADTGEQQEE